MKSNIAKVINIFGILMYIFGALAALGYYLIVTPAVGPAPAGTYLFMFIYIITGVFFGVMLQGFARVVQYLHDIRNQFEVKE